MMFILTYEAKLELSVMNYIRRNGSKSLVELEKNRQDLHPERAPSDSELEQTLGRLINEKRIILDQYKYSYNFDYQRPKSPPSMIIEPLGRINKSRFRFY